MNSLRCQWLLSSATALALQAGCSSSPPPPPNLRTAEVIVLTPEDEIQVSHRLQAQVRIESVTALQGVGVAFRLFPRAQYDAHDPDTDGHVLGTALVDVPAGAATYTVDLQVPYEIEPDDDAGEPEPFPAGEYYVVPEVDPRNTIAETDETQVLSSDRPSPRGRHRGTSRLQRRVASSRRRPCSMDAIGSAASGRGAWRES